MSILFFPLLRLLSTNLMILPIAFLCFQASAMAKTSERCGHSPLYGLKYTEEKTHFDYVNPQAPKGGKVRIARVGSFDSLNFLRYPGTTISSRREIPLLIEDYLFDSLLMKSADEPASFYCLVATKMEVGPQLSYVRFALNSKARWHDGLPITIEDLLFTFETLKKQGPPYYRQVLRTITAKKGKAGEIIYQNARLNDRNFIKTVGTLPIHPKHFWGPDKLNQKSMTLPLSSGPYRIAAAEAGKFAHLERVKNYWARDHFANKGRFNLDKIEIDYYRDNNSAFEGFKVGNYDIRLEREAAAWSKKYQGNKFTSGQIQKALLPASHAGDLYMLAFNQRRPLFQNPNVRKAFALLYDFTSANKILFHDLYNPVDSLYGDTPLAAKGAASKTEKRILTPFLNTLPKGILKNAQPVWQTSSLTSREKIRQASKLLDEAGFVVKDHQRIDPKSGEPLILSVSYLEPAHQRILLHYRRTLKTVGIGLSLPQLEPMAARRKALDHDFDMIVLKWTPERHAGTSEHLLWSSRLADKKGTYAFAGVKDPALDKAISLMMKAKDTITLEMGAKLFDRIFRWQTHAIPLWRQEKKWIALHKDLKRPAIDPSVEFSIVDRLWYEPQQQSSIQDHATPHNHINLE